MASKVTAAAAAAKLIPEIKDFTAAGIVEFMGHLLGPKGQETVLGIKAQQAVGGFLGIGVGDEAAKMEIEARLARQLYEVDIITEKTDDKGEKSKAKVKAINLTEAEVKAAAKNFERWFTSLRKDAKNRWRQIEAATKNRDDLFFLVIRIGRMKNDDERTRFALDRNWIRLSAVRILNETIKRLRRQ